jgi:NitT/TauT family transport system ATP-binding protein
MAVAQHHVSLTSVSHRFANGHAPLEALRDFTLAVPRGQFLSVIGPSGCGKSTILRIIGGLLRPTEGATRVDGSPAAAAQKSHDIGYVFQDPSLLPWRTVLGNVRLPLEVDGKGRGGAAGNGNPDPEELLTLLGLGEFRKYYPHQLSGGMQQRVAIARALAFNPSLMLMDEPFGALDEITREAMRYELLRIWESQAPGAARKTVVFVTHSIAEAVALSDRIIVMTPRPGTIRADIDIELPRPRTEEMERDRPFRDYVDQVRALLKEPGL